MITRITSLISLVLFIAFGLACSGEPKSNTNDHAAMNHNSVNANHGGMDHSAMNSSTNAADAPYDLQFLDTMAMHHQGAIDMAKGVEGRSSRSEINTLAGKIVADQEKEIAQMRRWRDEWFPGSAPAVNMEMAGMKDSMSGMDMQKLRSSAGVDLDLAFIDQMIPHHQGAVTMANDALRNAQKDEIKRMAEEIIKAQNGEIKQMQTWRVAWKK